MLNRPTTFIIGAGASAEFGLPDGRALMTQVSQALDVRFDRRTHGLISGDDHIVETLKSHFRNDLSARWMGACRQISAALPSLAASIDSYLDNHVDDENIQLAGRLAIVRSILNAERASKLFHDPRSDSPFSFAPLDQTWIGCLFRALTQRCPKSSVNQFFANVRMIIFNYDRCIERYFEMAISESYGIPIGNAKQIVKSAEFIHIYGAIGPLPEYSDHPQNEVPFGAASVQLIDASKRIRTYTDRVEEPAALGRIKDYVASAEVLVFLGFGFHAQNLEILTPERPRAAPTMIATAHNVSAFNRDSYAMALSNRFSEARLDPHFADKCVNLMQDFHAAF